jgi:amidophosphoribosyltransferase
MKKITTILKKKFKSFNPKIKEECGVFGISNNNDAAALTALGLHALQHRGQEGCGIVTFDGDQYHSEKRFGLVGDNFNKEKVLKNLTGKYAVGHNRYSTTGGTTLRNIQPFFADTNAGGISLGHNGNLTNAVTIRRELEGLGALFQSTVDSEIMLHLVSRSRKTTILNRFREALAKIEGAFSITVLGEGFMLAARDPFGFRPLVLGKLGKGYVVASETCAFPNFPNTNGRNPNGSLAANINPSPNTVIEKAPSILAKASLNRFKIVVFLDRDTKCNIISESTVD